MKRKNLLKALMFLGLMGMFAPTASAWIWTNLESPTSGSWSNYTNTTLGFVFNITMNYTELPCWLYVDTTNGTSNISANNSKVTVYWNATLTEGKHNWTFKCGNTTAEYIDAENTTHTYTFYLDRSAPSSVTINFPVTDWAYIDDTNVTFSYTAIDQYNASMHCNVTIDGILENESVSVTNNTLYKHVETGLTESTHEVIVKCVDGLGFGTVSSLRVFRIQEDSGRGRSVGVCSGGAEWNPIEQRCCGIGEYYDMSSFKCRFRSTGQISAPAQALPLGGLGNLDNKTMMFIGMMAIFAIIGYMQLRD